MLGSQPNKKHLNFEHRKSMEIPYHRYPNLSVRAIRAIRAIADLSNVAAEGAGEFTSAEASEALRRKAIL
jgi:hypothetical protein